MIRVEFLIFTALPAGVSFETTMIVWFRAIGDENNAFFNAHLAAAKYAAEERVESYVIRSDTGSMRYGFGAGAIHTPTTALYRIMHMGLPVFFDFGTCAWHPLPEEEAEEEVHAFVSA